MKNSTALVLAGATTSTTTNGNSKVLFDAWFKLDQISRRIDAEFQRVVLNQARQIAAAEPATFDMVTLVTEWTQQKQGYTSSATAISSLRTELDKAIGWSTGKPSDEQLQAAKETRQALQADLDKRNEADTAIEQQIKKLNKFIADASAAGQAGTTAANGQKSRGQKKGAKNPAKQAASKAAKGGKKGGKR